MQRRQGGIVEAQQTAAGEVGKVQGKLALDPSRTEAAPRLNDGRGDVFRVGLDVAQQSPMLRVKGTTVCRASPQATSAASRSSGDLIALKVSSMLWICALDTVSALC